jgi:hypothetical protein
MQNSKMHFPQIQYPQIAQMHDAMFAQLTTKNSFAIPAFGICT